LGFLAKRGEEGTVKGPKTGEYKQRQDPSFQGIVGARKNEKGRKK
jgi:hypothetical protein